MGKDGNKQSVPHTLIEPEPKQIDDAASADLIARLLQTKPAGAKRKRRRPKSKSDKPVPALHDVIRNHVFETAASRLSARGMIADDDRPNDTPRAALKRAFYEGAPSADSVLDGPVVRAFLHKHATVSDKLATLERIAQSLGDDWETDERSFLDVTIAMMRLQLVMRHVVLAHASEWTGRERGLAMLTTPLGEKHSFAQCLLEEIFRANGWATDLYSPNSADGMIERLSGGGHHIVCLSWSTDTLAPAAQHVVDAIESLPFNRRPAIIAGGHASHEHRGWMVRLGVDCMCESTYGALVAAHRLLDQRTTARKMSPAPYLTTAPPAAP